MFIIGAKNGGLVISKDRNDLVENIQTAKTLNYYLQKFDIDPDFDDIMFSSSMDFADEYGFDHYDDAKHLWQDGVQQWELSSVGSNA